ncbi:SPRY domain-containing protein 7 [Rhinatrema bivittatum]|uniref:SPRY domain-containing protein 7 n=1 Tax=Rhinatrema bivittatum TaxID=194408 RepID=UPI00112C70A0|nr:SPRY domain-containing protein 7 [Rhinatrema bivittatum]
MVLARAEYGSKEGQSSGSLSATARAAEIKTAHSFKKQQNIATLDTEPSGSSGPAGGTVTGRAPAVAWRPSRAGIVGQRGRPFRVRFGTGRERGRPLLSMASAFCCLRWCGDGGAGHIPLKEMPAVQLDTQHMGTDVVIVKNGRRICGTGACLANAPLHQNKSYFEFKIQSTGIWGVGVATQKANLNQVPLGRDIHSLVMRNDGAIYYNNEEKSRLPANSLPQEGDVVGITYDHVELNVYLNGKNMHCPASGIRGTVYPVVYVDDSAILDCQFSDFYHISPAGFEKILFEQQIF